MIISSATAVAVIAAPAPREVRDAVAQFSRLYPTARVGAHETDEGFQVVAEYDTKVIDVLDFVEGIDY